MWGSILDLLYLIPCAVIAISCHELAHGYMSYWLGDPTPKEQGRLSLNPLVHFDLVGFICLIFFRLGWAKPVQVDPRYYKKPKIGMAIVALAGPLMNFVIAIIALLIYTLLIGYASNTFIEIICQFFVYLGIINIGLGVFNLIPIPPLDGSKILGVVLSNESYEKYMSYERYGMYIILGLILLSDILGGLTGTDSLLSEVILQICNGILNLLFKIIY